VSAEKHLATQLALQARTMTRKGITDFAIDRELRMLRPPSACIYGSSC
jgi:hypothetical protein